MNIFRDADQPVALSGRLVPCALLVALCSTGVRAESYALGGGFEGTASVEASAVYADNYFYRDDNAIAASGYRIRPTVSASRTSGSGRIGISGYLDQAGYDLPGKLDESLDYGTTGSFLWRPLTRHSFDLSGGYIRGHDAAGLQRTEQAQARKADQWQQTTAGLTYRYGAAEALGSNSIRVAQIQRDYTNNRSGTVFLDYRVREIEYVLAYEYSPKTALLFTAGERATDYARPVISSGNRNGNELSLLTGLRWTATGKTAGEFQIGLRNNSIDGRARPSRQSLAWRGSVAWTPRSTTELKLSTGRSTAETFRADTLYIDDRRIGLNWQQAWTRRFNTNAGAEYTHSEFVGSPRTDNYLSGYAGFDFLLARQLKVFGQYTSRNRDSSAPGLDYAAPESKLGLRWSL